MRAALIEHATDGDASRVGHGLHLRRRVGRELAEEVAGLLAPKLRCDDRARAGDLRGHGGAVGGAHALAEAARLVGDVEVDEGVEAESLLSA
jgi:hypothetical protein